MCRGMPFCMWETCGERRRRLDLWDFCGARTRGRRLPVRLSATAVEVLDGPRVVARHERVAGKYAEILVLDHYLEVLRRKPGALLGATALAQARAAETRALIEVLLAHRTLLAAALTAAMAAAADSGVLDPRVIVIEARRRASGQAAPVIEIGALARYDRPAPALDAYDQLLTGNSA